MVSYRGNLLIPESDNIFLWNDPFHPKVRLYRMVSEENMYLRLMKYILNIGIHRHDRTNVGTRSVFGKTIEFSLQNNVLPLLTSKKVFFKGVLHELLWFLKGSTTTELLHRHNIKIWDGNSNRDFLNARGLHSYNEGELGPIYGYQWRHWGDAYEPMSKRSSPQKRNEGIDQINQIITTLKKGDHHNRRMILSAWNVSDLEKMVLPPCHCLCQFYVSDVGLCCALTQRSADVFLGLPFNIASYAILTRMIAHVCGLASDKLVIHLGDAHIYSNHVEQCMTQLKNKTYNFPTLKFSKNITDIDHFEYKYFVLEKYVCNPSIYAPMAV
jgi:thymidylate synthase